MGNFSEMIITVSNYDRRQAIEKGVVARDKVRVIHNGMPHLDANYLANPASQPPTIVMVARFMQQKDHATLLKALSTLQDRQWRVQFIGDGPLESAVRALSDNLGLLGRVEFLGERQDVDRILSNAQVFVLASHWEGLSRSTIEALRAGLPCVISDVGGMNELISEGVEGYLVPRNDSHLLAECLKRLIENPDLRARFGNAARQR